MPKQIQAPDGTTLEFPDDMPDTDIESVLQKEYPAPTAPTQRIVEPPSTLRMPTPIAEPPSTLRTPFWQPWTDVPSTTTPEFSGFGVGDPEYSGTIARGIVNARPVSELSAGVPTAMGISPEQVPSGREWTERVLGIPAEIREEYPAIRALEVAPTIASSVTKTALGLADYMSSPQGVMELAASASPAKLLVLGKWAYDMGKGTYESASELRKLLAKDDKTGEDWQAISDHTVNAIMMALGFLGAGKGAHAELERVTGRRAPLTRGFEEKKNKLAKDLADQLQKAELTPEPTQDWALVQPGGVPTGALPTGPLTPETLNLPRTEETGGPSAVYQESAQVLQRLQEPKIPQEGAQPMPAEKGVAEATQPREIASTTGFTYDAAMEQMVPNAWHFTDKRPGSPTAGLSVAVAKGADLAAVQKAIETKVQQGYTAPEIPKEPTPAPTAEATEATAAAATTEAPAQAEGVVGMGGATPAEFVPTTKFTTSNKNAVVDAERAERGLPPMMDLERQGNQQAWDEAMRKIDDAPSVQDELIAELAAQPRALEPVDNAILMHRRIDLRNEYEKALKRWRTAFESDDFEGTARESQRVREWSSKLADLEDITKATGAESGRSLQARKMMANEDYTMARMTLEMMEAKGRGLSAEEHADVVRLHDTIAKLQERITELESGRETRDVETTTTDAVKDTEKTAAKEPTSKDFDIDREQNLLDGIKAKVEKNQLNEITPLVQKLARVFWRQGIRGREPMIDALHGALQTIIPDFTRDQTKRAFSGYGNFKPLSKEAIDIGLRDLRGQTQQVLKMEAIEAKKPLEKTGVERRVPSDEERRLIKQVNELKRKYGVVVTDPATQLKSALQARKTYYEHRISDLKHEIATRERIVKTKSLSPTDPELQRLIEEHDRLKTEHDTIFPRPELTDEQRLKLATDAAKRNLAQWNVRLENAEKGVFDRRQPGRKVTGPELENIKAEIETVREHVKELEDMDAGLQAAKQVKSLEASIAEYERRLREGDLFSERKPAISTPEIDALRQQREALRQQLEQARYASPEGQAREQAARINALEDSLADTERRIREGDLAAEAKAPRVLSPAEQALKDKLDFARAELQGLREASGMYDAKRIADATKSVDAAIDEAVRQINEGDLAAKKAGRAITNPELEAKRAELAELNKIKQQLRNAAKPKKTPAEIALQSLKTRMASHTRELKEKIANNDFTKKERKPVALDPEGLRLKAELDKAKDDFNTALEKDRWAKLNLFKKTGRKIADVYDAARAIMTTGEFSFILRQGKVAALSRPIMTAKALPNMFKALLANPERARAIDLETHLDPAAEAAKQAKLYLVEEAPTRLSKQEEILMGRLVGKIPVVRNFNQAAQVFLNKIRLDMFKSMGKSMSKSGTPTPEENIQIAMFVNEATGRGGLGKITPAGVVLGRAMFAPRYYASRLQLAAGHSMWGGTPRSRRIIATEYARALVGLSLYYTALAMYFGRGEDEEKGKIGSDPRSTDFGKVKVGDTRLDPLAGLGQVAVLASRTATGEKTTLTGKVLPIRGKKVPFGGDKWTDIAARHLRGKLHPVPASIANLFDGTDLGGNEATVLNQMGGAMVPITYMDIYVALKEQGLEDGAALSLLGLLGEGIQTYKEKEK